MKGEKNIGFRASSSEKYGFVVVTIFLISSLALFFNPSWIRQIILETENGSVLAKMVHSKNDIRWKHSSQFSWYSPQANQALFNGDYIFVGKQSTAKVLFSNGNEIQLGENSLMKVAMDSKEETIDLRFGSVKLKIAKGKTLGIRHNNKIRKIEAMDDSEVIVNKSHEKSQILIQSGSTKFDEKDRVVESGQVVSFTESQEMEVSWEDNNEVFQASSSFFEEENLDEKTFEKPQVQEPDEKEEVSWSFEGSKERPIIISESELVEGLVETGEEESSFPTPLESEKPKGKKISKLKKMDREPTSMDFKIQIQKPKLKPLASPVLQFPRDKSHFVYFEVGTPMPVFFIWNHNPRVSSYLLQISKDAQFSKILYSRKVEDYHLNYSHSAYSGVFYWRVKSLKNNQQSKWSNVHSWVQTPSTSSP